MLKRAVLTVVVVGAGFLATIPDASAQMTGLSSASLVRMSGPRIATPRHFNGVVARIPQGQRSAIGQTIGGKANDGDEARVKIKGGQGSDVIVNSVDGVR